MQQEVIEVESSSPPKQIQQELLLSKEYANPTNKTTTYIVIPQNYCTQIGNKRNALNYLAQAKDGIQFKIQLDFDIKEESATLFVLCTPNNQQLDQSKIYKLSSILIGKNLKKQKDIKLEAKENVIKIPIPQKMKAYQLCLQNDLIIEISGKYNSRDEVGFSGIINNAATCYMNSVFQILNNLGIFQSLVFSINSNDHNQFPSTLQTLFYNLRSSKVAVSTQEIIKSFKWDIDQQAIQQDVQEFIMELLKALSTKAPQVEKQINELFQGQLENHIKNELFDNLNCEEFMDISLNITNSIEESLQLFVSYELLEGENAYNHDELGKQNAVKFHKFKKLPPILLINLKRYKYEDGGFNKIHDIFKYNESINFKDYLIYEQDEIYDLYAVLVHKGEAINHGHYYCFIKPFYQSQQWFKFDDKLVTRATRKEVFDNNFGGFYDESEYNLDLQEIVTQQKNNPETAYMLVYIKQKIPPILELPIQFPEWIEQTQQIQLDLQNQKKHFILTNLFSIEHLNMESNTDIKTGIIFHKQAFNQMIDFITIDEFFDKNTTPFLIPKQISIQQMIDQLSEKIQINKTRLHLFIYKISHVKPNQESIIYMNPQKQLQFYLVNKLYKWAIFILSDNFEDQALINNFLTTDQIKLEQVQQNGKGSKDHNNNIQNKFLIFVKEVQNNQILFQQPIIMDKILSINQLLQEKYLDQNLLLQNDQIEFVKPPEQFKNFEYLQLYIDQNNILEQEITKIKNKREVAIKMLQENQCTSSIFDKEESTEVLLNYLASIEECNPENIQLKYKDKRGNYIILQQTLKIEQLIQYDNQVNYKQTTVPVGAMKEQMSFECNGKSFIISKNLSFNEFMEQENLQDTIPLLISKKDKRSAWVLLEKSSKISRASSKNNIFFVQPLLLGEELYLVCILQSVEIIQLCNPIVCRISKSNIIGDILVAVFSSLSNNQIIYKTQQLQIFDDCITSTEDDKTKKLDLSLRLKICNQEISQDSLAEIGSLFNSETQAILIITFLSIRDTKTDKLRQKGVQIL